MKRYVKSSEKKSVDLSKWVKIGQACLDELRTVIPEIPDKPRRRRSHAWSDQWYIEFDLGINLRSEADYYASSKFNPWGQNAEYLRAMDDYFNDIKAKCESITDKYEGCTVDSYGTRGVFQGHSTLTVFTGIKCRE